MAQVFTLPFRVRDYELDQYGVVNNAVYLNYLEHARHEFMEGIGVDPAAIAASGRALALSEITLRFRTSLRSKDAFRVELRINQIRGARVIIDQRILRMPEETLVLSAEAQAVFLDEQGRPLRVAEEHRAAFLPYLVEAS